VDARNLAATLVGFGVAASILAGLAVVVGAGDVAAALGRARAGPVALVGAAIVAWLCLWGAGLRAVFGAIGAEISAVDAVLVYAGAAFANHVTPFGQAGGEPVAAWLLADVSGAPYERALATVASFDAVNVAPSLGFGALGLWAFGTASVLGERLRILAAGVVVLAVAISGGGFLAWRRRRGIEAGVTRIAVGLSRRLGGLPVVGSVDPGSVEERVEGFVEGIERIAGDRRRVALALCFSACGWLVQVAGLWIALWGLGATVPPYVPLFVVPLGTIASALPTPGGLGGVETAQVSLLALSTGASNATLAAAVTIFSVGGFFLTTALGAAAVAVLQVRERNVRSLV
jgi:uncharacterized protein (TIRG00374 family)